MSKVCRIVDLSVSKMNKGRFFAMCVVEARFPKHWRDVVCWETDWIEPVAVISRAGFKQLLFTQIQNLHPSPILVPTSTDCVLSPLDRWKIWQVDEFTMKTIPFLNITCFRMLFLAEAQVGPLSDQDHLLHPQLLHYPHPHWPLVLRILTPRKKRWSLLNLNICSGTSCWQKLKIEKDRNLLTNTKWKTFPKVYF